MRPHYLNYSKPLNASKKRNKNSDAEQFLTAKMPGNVELRGFCAALELHPCPFLNLGVHNGH